jgi:hypothetical protein
MVLREEVDTRMSALRGCYGSRCVVRLIVDAKAKDETPSTLERRISALRDLKTNWDGQGAEPPSASAIDTANWVVQALTGSGASPDDIEIDADVLGGVAVWFYPPRTGGMRIWIACMNSGSCVATILEADRSNVFSLDIFRSPST